LEAIAVLRDLSLIFLAVENIIFLGILIFLALQVWKFVKLGKQHVGTLTDSATEVFGTVKETTVVARHTVEDVAGTVGYVNDRTVRPLIELYAAVAGATRFVRAVFSPNRPPTDRELAEREARDEQ